MKLKSTLLLLIFSICTFVSFSQHHNCGSHDGYLEEQKDKFPQFYKSLEDKNIQLEEQNTKLLSKISPDQKSSEKKLFLLLWPEIYTIQLEFFTQIFLKKKINKLQSNRLINILKEPGIQRSYFLRFIKHKFNSYENYKPIIMIKNDSSVSWLPDFIINDFVKTRSINIIKTRKDDVEKTK